MHVRGHIDDKTMEYLTPEDPKPGRFYLLPNIHKENNPGRPIVSANGHPTEKISEFIDFHLRPFVENLPSHIKDTTDYLKKMENLAIQENTTLVTIPMMTELPHAEKYGNNEQFKNLYKPSIKFTHKVSKTKISFLDTTTTVKEGNMTTDLYSKPTDKHQYLSPSSFHPKWSRALDVRLSEWCCSVSMVWVQIPSREEQKFDSSKI